MRKTQTLLLLVMLSAALLSSGCSAKEQLEEKINAAVPVKDLAFIQIDLGALDPAFKCLKPLVVICLLAIGWNLYRWQQREGGWGGLLTGGTGKWFVLMILVGAPAICLAGFNEIGKTLWPDALDFNMIRDALGWKIPLLEGLPEADATPQTVMAAIATIPLVTSWHIAFEVGLVVLLPVFILWAMFSRSLKPLMIWGLAYVCWAMFGPGWYIGLTFIRGVRGGNIITSTLKQVNMIFLILTWGLMIILSVLPVIAASVMSIGGGGGSEGGGGGESWLWEAIQTGAILRGQPEVEKAMGHGGNPGPGSGTVIYGQDPQSRAKLPPPKRLLGSGGDRSSTTPPGPDGQPPGPEGKGSGQLPKAKEMGPLQSKAHGLSTDVGRGAGAVAGGALAPEAGVPPQVGATAGATAVEKLPGPPSMLESAARATDKGIEALGLGGNELEDVEAERALPDDIRSDGPLPPPQSLTGSEGGADESPSTEGGSGFAGLPTQPAGGGRTKYYIDGDIVDPEGRILYRNGQLVFPDQVTDEGLKIGDDQLPWESVTIEGEVS